MNICACGCGQEIAWQKHHNYRLPKYLPGHFQNTQEFRDIKKGFRTDPPPDFNPTGFCECGCGKKTPISSTTSIKRGLYKGYPIKYIHGHNGRGEKSPTWKGGCKQNKRGYRLIFIPDHHLAFKTGYVYEHRLVWEQHNNRRLSPNEHVHHIDGNPSNNSPENLVALTKREHHKLHNCTPEARNLRSIACKTRYKNPKERLKASIAAKVGWETRRKNQSLTKFPPPLRK